VTPWLSILMPTYNGAAWLGEALASVASQDLDGVELLAVDDGSTDDTLAILRSFESRLPLRVTAGAHVGNWVASTNRALAEAKGEYVSLLHQDDLHLAGRLARMRAVTRENPDVDLLLHQTAFVDERGRRIGLWSCPLPEYPQRASAETILGRLAVQNWIGIPSPVFRARAAREVGGMDEQLWFTADWDLWGKLAARGPVVYLGECLAAFRIHPGSQTVTGSHDLAGLRQQVRTASDRILQRLHQPSAARRAAALNAEVTVSLAALAHRQAPPLGALLAATMPVALRPHAWWPFLRDSRIVQRVTPRLRASTVR
jgi:GT2 family glycosyltransferase